MNETRNIQDAELDRMVQAYFDCTLTAGEERDLGVRLAALSEDRLTDSRREALAGISLTAMARRRASGKQADARRAAHPAQKKRVWLVAAAAVVASLIFIPRIWQPDTDRNECYAYVDGQLVTDREEIARMVAGQFDDLAEAKELTQIAIDDQLAGLSSAMDDFYNKIPLNLSNYQLVISN